MMHLHPAGFFIAVYVNGENHLLSCPSKMEFSSYHGDVAQYDSIQHAWADIPNDYETRGLTFYICTVGPIHKLERGAPFFDFDCRTLKYLTSNEFVPRYVIQIHKIIPLS